MLPAFNLVRQTVWDRWVDRWFNGVIPSVELNVSATKHEPD